MVPASCKNVRTWGGGYFCLVSEADARLHSHEAAVSVFLAGLPTVITLRWGRLGMLTESHLRDICYFMPLSIQEETTLVRASLITFMLPD